MRTPLDATGPVALPNLMENYFVIKVVAVDALS
jgi:ribosomal protein S10